MKTLGNAKCRWLILLFLTCALILAPSLSAAAEMATPAPAAPAPLAPAAPAPSAPVALTPATQVPAASPTAAPAPTPKTSTIEMGLMYYHFDYQEDLVSPHKSTENGWVPGTYISYTYKKDKRIYGRIFAQFAGGDLTYDGSTQTGTPVTFTDNPQRFFKLEWHVGYPFSIGNNFSVIPFLGMGYRYWERGEAKVTNTYVNYKEIYQWNYLPLGVKLEYKINNYLEIGGTVTANLMWYGTMRAYLSDVVAGADDPEFEPGSRPGAYAELPIRFRFTPAWAITATPWYEYSAFGRSDSVVTYDPVNGWHYVYEPASKTHQYGINVGVSFSF